MFCPPGVSFAVYEPPGSNQRNNPDRHSWMIFSARDKTLLFWSYLYVKGACVSTAVLVQHVAMFFKFVHRCLETHLFGHPVPEALR